MGLLLLTSSLCGAIPRGNADAVAMVYSNTNYGFIITLSPSKNLLRTAAPNPNHGFGVAVPGAKLWADASYTDSPSAAEQVELLTSGCAINERRLAPLGSASALSVRFSCPKKGDHEAYVELLVVAVRRVGDRSPASYQVGMRASSSALIAKNMSAFNAVVAGFRFED
ncbi:MAG: hypothetical protein JSS45_05085 [Proteobacteria bacterium]|nr:hypothetical protein [Pseudomonadota bacterium]